MKMGKTVLLVGAAGSLVVIALLVGIWSYCGLGRPDPRIEVTREQLTNFVSSFQSASRPSLLQLGAASHPCARQDRRS